MDSLAALADRPENSTGFPVNCDFHVHREKAHEMDEEAEFHGLTVSRVRPGAGAAGWPSSVFTLDQSRGKLLTTRKI